MHESVQLKGRALTGEKGRTEFRSCYAHSGQKLLDRTRRNGVECAAPEASVQDGFAQASGEESGHGSSRRDRAARWLLQRQIRVEHRHCLLLRAPITFTTP